MTSLDKRLRAAHEKGDSAALVLLYAEAASQAADADTEAFYLTHAHVFALEIGDPAAHELRQRLIELGREQPVPPARSAKR